jgi:hypothetical protein
MKRWKKRWKKKNAPPPSAGGIANDFVRGFVSFAAFAAQEKGAQRATVARQATLYGVALVAAVAAGNAIERRDYPTLALAAVGGLAGVYLLNQLLDNNETSGE